VIGNLNNSYYLMRHGRSLANNAGIIISSLEDGSGGWGLAEGSLPDIRAALKGSGLSRDTVFFSSPFKRALETAWCAADYLSAEEVRIDKDLRERFFGDFEGTDDKNYHRVWQDDGKNPDNGNYGVESPRDVLYRLKNFIHRVDMFYSHRTICLVSHGDPLNILLTHTAGLGVEEHRNIVSMKTSELRPLFP